MSEGNPELADAVRRAKEVAKLGNYASSLAGQTRMPAYS